MSYEEATWNALQSQEAIQTVLDLQKGWGLGLVQNEAGQHQS